MSEEKDHKCTFHDDDDDIMDEDKRSAYSNMPTNKRLTMKYDMGALKKIGEYEDALREKLGVVFKCDPDELPIDLDLNEIYALEPQDRQGALTELLRTAEGDHSALITETIEKMANM